MKNDVSSFFFYMWNAWCEEECKIVYGAEYKHFWNKWCYNCEEYGHRAAVDILYGELSDNNRDKLVARALQCYDGNKEIH